MSRFKEGDFVKVKDDYTETAVNSEWISKHGYLWLVKDIRINYVCCKSLATGAEGWFWREHGLEKADD